MQYVKIISCSFFVVFLGEYRQTIDLGIQRINRDDSRRGRRRFTYKQWVNVGIELGFECTIMIDNMKHLAKIKVTNDWKNIDVDLLKKHRSRPFEHNFRVRKDFYYWPAVVCETCNCGEKRSIPSRQFQVSWYT